MNSKSNPSPRLCLHALLFGFAVAGQLQVADAQDRKVPDTYTATTAQMTPAGVGLRIVVTDWSDEDARAEVIAALSNAEEGAPELSELPTAGVVWRDNSGVGHSIKYAHRAPTDDGGERVTVVTDKRLDSYSYQSWAPTVAPAATQLNYSVIELRLDSSGSGTGTLSMGAEVAIDTAGHTITLNPTPGTPELLIDAKREPKPYWANGG